MNIKVLHYISFLDLHHLSKGNNAYIYLYCSIFWEIENHSTFTMNVPPVDTPLPHKLGPARQQASTHKHRAASMSTPRELRYRREE
jgi:hypothetical protein